MSAELALKNQELGMEWKSLKNFLQPETSKNTGLPQFFSKVSDNCILRTSIF